MIVPVAALLHFGHIVPTLERLGGALPQGGHKTCQIT